MESITAQRNKLSLSVVANLEKLFTDAGIEFFRTGANLNTITFEAGEIAGAPVYGSIKFTLHKADYNLDEEIEDFEIFYETRQKKEEERARRAEKEEKEKVLKAQKIKEKKELDELKRQKMRENLSK